MKKYDFILFDLDGTLTDPAAGITNSVVYSLQKFGIESPDMATLYKFIGPPLHESYRKYFGFSDNEITMAIEYYREYFRKKGIFENTLYDGIADLLEALIQSGKTLALATSKPDVFATDILRHFGIEKYFSFSACATLDGARTGKADVISYALEAMEIKNKNAVIMIGDREHDVIGANKNEIDSIGVLFGYGSREELENAGASYIAETVEDIKKILL